MKHPSFPALLTLACLMVAPSLTAQRRYQSKPPVPAALLGIVPTVQSQLAGRSSSVNACSVQGTGSLSAPYQLVQVPGFDCARDPNTSPWQAPRLHEMDENNQPVPVCTAAHPVSVVRTDRDHARLRPFYRDLTTGGCTFGPACDQQLFPLTVALRQGFINAGGCGYGSISFDVRLSDFEATRCATHPYAEVIVDEIHPTTGSVTETHRFLIDRTTALQRDLYTWQRLTYHFEVENPGYLFNVAFRLVTSSCSSSNNTMIYAGIVDIDNVSLLTIPLVNIDNGAITSGCQSGDDACPPLGVIVVTPAIEFYEGVQVHAGAHDSYSPAACPQSYCAADLNYDGRIDGQDLAAVLADWNTLPIPSCIPRWADINGNRTVGGDDLALILAGWGPCPL